MDEFADRAISGATTIRPGFQGMMTALRNGGIDVVLAESLDRFSRDQEHIAGFYKQVIFAGARVFTLAEGEISELHVGLKGTMGAIFLKDLAQKTHRGLESVIRSGKSAGGKAYGYTVVRQTDAQGEPVRGGRAIDDAQAATVREIFRMFAAGTSPIAIAKELNASGIPGPEGRAWRDTTIRGHAARGTGILRNELYIGRLVWNRMRFIKDPNTDKRVSRPNLPTSVITEEVPALRIIDQDVWDRVQQRLGAIRAASGADRPDRPRYWEGRRAQHLLTGKLACGSCGGAMTDAGRGYLACTAARRQGICTNRQAIPRVVLDKLVLDALRQKLMRPEHVSTFVAEFTAEWNRLQSETFARRFTARQELERVTRKLAGVIEAITDGLRAPGLQQKLDELEARKAALEGEIAAAPAPILHLHPNIAGVYSQKVAGLQDALHGPDSVEALEAARALIAHVVVRPNMEERGFEIELEGELAALLRIGMDNVDGPKRAAPLNVTDSLASSLKVVAGTGNHRQLTLITVPC